MCLVKVGLFPRIALSPKKVYKILARVDENKFATPYIYKIVELGKSYKGEFSSITFLESLFNGFIADGYIHCFRDIHFARRSPFFGVLVECEIPAGTLYWRGVGGEIATRKLKYIKEV